MENRNELKDIWLSQTFSTSMPIRKEIIIENGYVTVHYSGPEGYSEYSTYQKENAENYAQKELEKDKYKDYKLINIK
jgi:hypothetical protein